MIRKYGLLFACLLSSLLHGENITVIGVGRLGLCLALCLEKAGHNVVGVDLSTDYVEKINAKTLTSFEPLVEDYLRNSQNFSATTSLDMGLAHSQIYFIVLPTNTIAGVETYDHTILNHLLEEMNHRKLAHKHLVICCTVFPGYIKNTAEKLISDCVNTTISYNPEFIAQGAIIHGMRNPDLVLIGEASKEAGDRLVKIYQTLCSNAPHIARMSVESAEIAKLALNCFITAKIAFTNLIGDIADTTPGADKQAILSAIGKDHRIGPACLSPGYGYGGPCFPRDNRALGNYASLKGIDPLFFRTTDQTNAQHTAYMTKKLLENEQDEYLFEDVCYKPNCPVPILEASQKLEIAKQIAHAGKSVSIKDRKVVIEQLQKEYGNLFNYIVKDRKS